MNKRWWGAAVGAVAVGAGGMVAFGMLGGEPGKAIEAASASDGTGSGAGSAGGSHAKGGGKGGDKKPDVPLEFVTQEVVQPRMARIDAVVDFGGPLVAPQTAMVRAKAGGTLLSLSVGEGSRVQAGQILGRIEMAEMGSRLAERDAMMASARATLSQAERTYANNERLAQQQFISASALDVSRAALDTARAQLGAAQASLDTTRVGLRDGVLVAPIAGIVAKRHALPGEKVSPEQQVLTIVDLARLELAGTVGMHDVARLAHGAQTQTTVQVQVEGMDAPVAGRIARIAPAAEPGTRSIGVTIALDNPKEALRAGQYAVARAVLVDTTQRLTLPMAAVGNTSGQDHVWVIESGTLARRAVTLGRRDEREGRVEVLQGVKPESRVLAVRFDNLREGAKALVVENKSVPTAPEQTGRAAVVASSAASTPVNVK